MGTISRDHILKLQITCRFSASSENDFAYSFAADVESHSSRSTEEENERSDGTDFGKVNFKVKNGLLPTGRIIAIYFYRTVIVKYQRASACYLCLYSFHDMHFVLFRMIN